MRSKGSPNEDIETWFELYADEIYRFARYSAPKSVDPKDVVQEVFLRAYRSWNSFRDDSSPKTWLFRIARNYIYDLLRKKRREREYEMTHRIPDASVHLDTVIELEDALSRLHPAHQQVLNLRWMQEMSVTETAAVLGWSESKVRVTFHRAKKKLQEVLQDSSDDVIRENHSQGGEPAHGRQ